MPEYTCRLPQLRVRRDMLEGLERIAVSEETTIATIHRRALRFFLAAHDRDAISDDSSDSYPRDRDGAA